MQITSPANERIKHARRVRDGREDGLIFVEGLRLAEECFKSGCQIETAFVAENLPERGQRLLADLTQKGISTFTVSDSVITALSSTVQSQGIIFIARRPTTSPDLLQSSTSLWLGLDRLQDPGNMGTLLRTAEAAGVGSVLALGHSVDVFSPKVLRSSMGSAFRLPVLSQATVDNLLHLRQTTGLKLVAAAGEGELDYCDYDWTQPTLLLLGNEGQGVDPALMNQCDVRLRIPMQAGVESLNVAAAGAVMLFEAARQRRLKSRP